MAEETQEGFVFRSLSQFGAFKLRFALVRVSVLDLDLDLE